MWELAHARLKPPFATDEAQNYRLKSRVAKTDFTLAQNKMPQMWFVNTAMTTRDEALDFWQIVIIFNPSVYFIFLFVL